MRLGAHVSISGGVDTAFQPALQQGRPHLAAAKQYKPARVNLGKIRLYDHPKLAAWIGREELEQIWNGETLILQHAVAPAASCLRNTQPSATSASPNLLLRKAA